MANPIDRPVFYEGQILAAADLQGTIDHATSQLARHERYLHSWGIASGLSLTKQDKSLNGQAYVEVTLSAGMASDGTGREVLVDTDWLLSEADFDQSSVAAGVSDLTTAWFPVFLVGRDEAGSASSAVLGCSTTGTTRTVETFTIEFGRPGDAANLDSQIQSAVSDGPGNGAWRILVGFVQWASPLNKFTAIGTSDQGVTPRYAGVQADDVTARGGALTLRSQPRSQPGPAVVMDNTNGGQFSFGLENATGKFTPVLTVTAQGKIQGVVTPGSVQVQSGTATDGVILPLPPGITEAMVAPGSGTLHVLLTPRLGGMPPSSAGDKWGSFSLDCSIDSSRRVSCMVRWYDLTNPAGSIEDLPGLCDYLMVVAAPAASGGP
jgi:hypothetical protein